MPFLVGGSLAAWARGGPQTRHDLDLMIKQADVERALTALTESGMRIEDPPEEWLVKAWDGDVLVDLIFSPVLPVAPAPPPPRARSQPHVRVVTAAGSDAAGPG